MAKLTSEQDWDYSRYVPPGEDHFESITQKAGTWIDIARKNLPESGTFLELGCAPGYCSAVINYKNKNISLTGVDFSPSADSYLSTLKSIGILDAKLIKANLFEFKTNTKYDVVGSFGLIEHFSGADLEKILSLHDEALKPGGTLIIEVPNFNGISGLWHRIFDAPSYSLHNISAMQPSIFDKFRKLGYTEILCEYVGPLEVWGDSGAYRSNRKWLAQLTIQLEAKINNLSRRKESNGSPLTGRFFSPALIFVAHKPLITNKK